MQPCESKLWAYMSYKGLKIEYNGGSIDSVLEKKRKMKRKGILGMLLLWTQFGMAQQTATERKVLERVRHLPKVQKVSQEVERLSHSKRRLKYIMIAEDSTKAVYQVMVCEDNGMSYATHFNFRVDARTLKILSSEPSEF